MPESEPKPKLIELVGGGAGQGWKAVLRSGKPAVVHEIPVPQAEATAAVPRLQRLFEHRHPALSPVLAWGTDVNGIWVAVEPNEGTPLSSILSRGPLSPPAAAALGAAVLSGVAALHETGIAMGGFGATAVRVTSNGEVRLAGHPAAAVRGAPSQSDLRADVRSCGMAVCAAFGVDPAGSPAPPNIPPGLIVTMRSMASGAMGPSADRAQGALREMAAPLLAPDRQMAAQSELATRAGGREVPAIAPFLPGESAPPRPAPLPSAPPAAATPPAPAPYIAPPRREETPVRTPVSYEAPDRPVQTYPSAPAVTYPPVPVPPAPAPPSPAAASAPVETPPSPPSPPSPPAIPTWSEAPPRTPAPVDIPPTGDTTPPAPAPPTSQPSWLVDRPAAEPETPKPMPAFEPVTPTPDPAFTTSAPPPPSPPAPPVFDIAPPEAPEPSAFPTSPPPPAPSFTTNPPTPSAGSSFGTAPPPPATAPPAPAAPPAPTGGSSWSPVEAPVWKPGAAVPSEPLGTGYAIEAPTLDQPRPPAPLRPPTSPPMPRQTVPRPPRQSEPPERPGWLVPGAVAVVVIILLGIFGVVVLPRLTGGKAPVASNTSPSAHPSGSAKPSPGTTPSGGAPQTVPSFGPASATPVSKILICAPESPCNIPGASAESGSVCDLASCKVEIAIYFTAVQKSVQVSYTLKFFDRCTGQTTDLPGTKTTTPSTGWIVAIPTDHLPVNIPGGVKSGALVAVSDQPAVAASPPLLLGSDTC